MNPSDSQPPPPKPKTKFTPIKVRGKKTTSIQTQQAPVTTKHRLTDMADHSNPPKRPHRIKPRRAGSALIEQLPLEILEHIFCLSKNVHFPQSSPFIGCALSSRLTLLRLVVAAFGPTWDVWFGCVPATVHSYSGPHSYNAWQRDGKRIGGDPQFQTDVLACRRVDVSVLLDAQKLWLGRQTAPRLLDMPPFNHPPNRAPINHASHRTPVQLNKYLSEPEPPVGRDEPATGEDIERCFEWEWKCHVAWCDGLASLGAIVEKECNRSLAERQAERQENLRIKGASSETMIEYRIDWLIDQNGPLSTRGDWYGLFYKSLLWVYSTPSSIGLHPKVRIPDSLLVGPLDWAKAKLLFWYTRQGAQLDDQHTWELTVLGYENLMKLDDPKLRLVILGLFVHLRVFNDWPYWEGRSAVLNYDIRKKADIRTTEEAAELGILFMAVTFPCEGLAQHNERPNERIYQSRRPRPGPARRSVRIV